MKKWFLWVIPAALAALLLAAALRTSTVYELFGDEVPFDDAAQAFLLIHRWDESILPPVPDKQLLDGDYAAVRELFEQLLRDCRARRLWRNRTDHPYGSEVPFTVTVAYQGQTVDLAFFDGYRLLIAEVQRTPGGQRIQRQYRLLDPPAEALREFMLWAEMVLGGGAA